MYDACVRGGSISARAALTSVVFWGGFLPKYSAPSISSLSDSTPSLKNITPSISKLSHSKATHSKKLNNLLDSKNTPIRYTQKQLECSETMGVDLTECTRNGRLIRKPHTYNEYRSIQKRNDMIPQQGSADGLDEYNDHGVFKNRTEQVSNKILEQLDVNTWDTITTSDLARIKLLDLQNSGITTLSEKDLEDLTGLTTLNINNNELTLLSIPDTLVALILLNISHNKLLSISIPNTLISLEKLYLNNNQLSSITLGNELIHLKIVNLSDNKLTSITLPDTLNALNELFLNDNQLLSITLPNTGTNFYAINLSNNHLSSIIFPDTFSYIYQMNLNGNNLTSFTIPDIAVALEKVDISHNQLSSFTFSHILPHLFSLDLSNNLLTTINIPSTLRGLNKLDISYNLLTQLKISEDILERLNTLLLLKGLFTNLNLAILFNKNGQVNFADTSYHWMDIRSVFSDGLIGSTTTHDTLQIDSDFQFPEFEQLSNIEILFLSDLNTSFPIPFTKPTVPTPTNTSIPLTNKTEPSTIETETSETNNGDGNTQNNVSFWIILALSVFGLFVACLAVVGVGIFINRKYHQYKVTFNDTTDIEKNISTKFPDTYDNTLFHKLALDQPKILEKWVSEEKLSIESDLGNTKEHAIDDDGNSILHVLAISHWKTLDKWIKEKKTSYNALDLIKNNNGQSVLFYIENIAPEVFNTWNYESTL